MDINLGGIKGKLEKNAMAITFALTAWERAGSLNGVINQYTNFRSSGQGNYGFIGELENTLRNTGLLKYKLLDSPHMYTTAFKYSAIAYIAAELGVIPVHYKKLTKDVMIGAAAVALTMPGSGPGSQRSGSTPTPSANNGYWSTGS